MKSLRQYIRSKNVYLLIIIIIFLTGLVLILLGPSRICEAIGTSLIAGGIISLLNLWYQFIEEKNRERLNNINVAGVNFVYEKRDIDRYDELMESFNTIDITGYSLRGFYESFRNVVRDRLSKKSDIKVRILVVDPASLPSNNREKLENHPEGVFATNIYNMKSFFSGYQNIEIRKIAFELPSMIFRIDDVMFVGPYLFQEPSKSTVTFELDSAGRLFSIFEREFDKLWEKSSSV